MDNEPKSPRAEVISALVAGANRVLSVEARASTVALGGQEPWLTLDLGGRLTWALDRCRLGGFVVGGLTDAPLSRRSPVSGGLSFDEGFQGPVE